MLQIDVIGLEQTPNSTLCKMLIDGEYFSFVIEDGYRAIKEKHNTRIPDGTYEVVKRTHGKFFERYKKLYKHKFVPEVVGVPGFFDILFHGGNRISDTSGCTMPNRWAGFDSLNQVFVGKDSLVAYCELYARIDATFAAGAKVFVTHKRDHLNKKDNAPSNG